MRYLAARRKHGMLSLAALLAGALLVASPAMARSRLLKPIAPPDRIAQILSTVDVSGPACSSPLLSQPFTAWGDKAYYTLAPGQSVNDFTGDGWLLYDGANVATAPQADGTRGQVLDLPAGSLAVSPTMCVSADYPTARTMIRNVAGGGGVGVFVTYADGAKWGKARNGGNAHGPGPNWGPSDRINLQPSHAPGWQLIRFALVPPNGPNGDFQLYNFYVDPYARG
jgi:hypothetical protein